MSDAPPLVALAAGGTGGHLFPAEALAVELLARGVAVELVTDARAVQYAAKFPARAVHAVSSATIAGRSPAAILSAARHLGLGFGESLRLLRLLKPSAVVGFGGYPTVPPLAAAALLRIPTVVHEQNAVMGRANRLLAGVATAIGTGFPALAHANARMRAKALHVGNPVRPAVLAAAARPYAPPDPDGRIQLLVFGGSQGARVMSDILPPALAQLDSQFAARLSVVQQARSEDLPAVEAAYRAAGIAADIQPFFTDLPKRMAEAHLVVARSGASTVAELAVIGRPSLLVPLPHSLDQDQLANANALADAGGATVIPQTQFTPAVLAGTLADLFADPAKLARQAASARAVAVPDASSHLADLVIRAANRHQKGPLPGRGTPADPGIEGPSRSVSSSAGLV